MSQNHTCASYYISFGQGCSRGKSSTHSLWPTAQRIPPFPFLAVTKMKDFFPTSTIRSEIGDFHATKMRLPSGSLLSYEYIYKPTVSNLEMTVSS